MKYILLLLTLFLFGCTTQREKDLSQLAFARSIEILKIQEKLNQYNEPENMAQPLMVRNYKLEDGESLKIIEPKDCLLGMGLEYKFRNIKTLIVCDNTYWLPSREFVSTKLLPQYQLINKATYNTKFDCDDFSRQFAFWSQLFFARVVINKQMEAIAVAEVHYLKRTSVINIKIKIPLEIEIPIPIFTYEKHAINAIVLDDTSVIFIEPQTGKQEILSEEEIKSIYFCRF